MVKVSFRVKCETRIQNASVKIAGGNAFLGQWDAHASQLELTREEKESPWWSGSCELSDFRNLDPAGTSTSCSTPEGETDFGSWRMVGEDQGVRPVVATAFWNFAIVAQGAVWLEDKIKGRCFPGASVGAVSLIYQGEFNVKEAALTITSHRRVLDIGYAPPSTPPKDQPATPNAVRRAGSQPSPLAGWFFEQNGAWEATPSKGHADEDDVGHADDEPILKVQHALLDRGLLQSGMAGYSRELPTVGAAGYPTAVVWDAVPSSSFWVRLKRTATAALNTGKGQAQHPRSPKSPKSPKAKPALRPSSIGRRARAGGA